MPANSSQDPILCTRLCSNFSMRRWRRPGTLNGADTAHRRRQCKQCTQAAARAHAVPPLHEECTALPEGGRQRRDQPRPRQPRRRSAGPAPAPPHTWPRRWPRHIHMGSLSACWLRRRSPGTGGSGATRYVARWPRRGNARPASAPLTLSASLAACAAGRSAGERDLVSCQKNPCLLDRFHLLPETPCLSDRFHLTSKAGPALALLKSLASPASRGADQELPSAKHTREIKQCCPT